VAPAPQSRSESRDEDIPTLTPIPSEPGSPAIGSTPGLQPLDDAYALQPLSSPGWQDPLAGLPPANPLGLPPRSAAPSNPFGPSANPYQSPASGYAPSRGYGYAPQRTNTAATSALVCGILGIVAGLCCPLIGFPLNITAIVLGFRGLHQPNMGMAIGGLVCGFIGLLITVLNAIVGVLLQLQSLPHQRFPPP
jgi:hypothetical protein